jgi:sulfate/thiosulfate transport system ATP-binding protein
MSIRVEHLCKRFGDFIAVDDATFEVGDGELVGLLGPSGSGKSTILRIIAGLDFADSGQVYLDGEVAGTKHAKDRKVGFVFQHYALFRHMTVAENIGFGLDVQGVKADQIKLRVREMLDLVGLAGTGERYPAQLSGGQRQRVALARALAPAPRLLLLDEPFGAVDAKVRKELRGWLRRLHDEMHVTSVFVTHDQDEAFDVADRMVLVNKAKVEQTGTPREILERPTSEFVAAFFGDVNLLEAEIKGTLACAGPLCGPVSEPPADGSLVRLVVRSYDIKLWADPQGFGTVKRMLPMGDRVRVEASIDDLGPIMAHFPRRSSLLRGMTVGGRVSGEITFSRAYPRNAAAPGASLVDGTRLVSGA